MAQSLFLKTLQDRGYIHQCTNMEGLDEVLSSGVVPAYIGFDLTAKSLHVGNLMSIMTLRHFQKSGHKPIIILGGATTKIGDPSGKDEARKMLTDEDINANKESIKKVFSKFLKFGDALTDAIIVDNSEWLMELKYIEMLRDVGRHFSINRMMSFDSVKLRLDREQPLSFLEFNYMILQAYDFVMLNKKYGCRLEMGGSDQWGNIVSGTELGRKMGTPELFGLTTPLITKKSGEKMGKSVSGAIWLNEDMFSAYDYWQFWRNTEDEDVARFMKLFTDLSLSDIAEYEKLQGKDINIAKIALANAATTLCHGAQATKHAEETARKTFEQGQSGDELPVFEVDKSELEAGIPAFKLFAMSGLSDSNSMARKLVQGNGAKINNIIVASEQQIVTLADLVDGQIKLSSGQKRHLLVKLKS